MGYLYNVDKDLIRQVMELGGFRTQVDAVRSALRLYLERRGMPTQVLGQQDGVPAHQTKKGEPKWPNPKPSTPAPNVAANR